MEWSPGGDNSDIEDRRGESYGGGGGGFGFGGGGGLGIVGFIVLLVISLITGRNYIGAFFGGGGQPRTQQVQEGPIQESSAEHRSAQLVGYVLRDAQNTWTQVLPAQTGHQYRHAKLVLYRGITPGGCGDAQASTGPFYCPEDEKVYIDLDFWNELKQMGGDTGDFAQSYVIAHELGHHVQKILGTEQRVSQASGSQRNAMSVKLELQADCYAGIWGHETQQRSHVDENDIEGAIKAAAAVGDDHLQKMSGRAVSPETWTHGSSAQRIEWFKRGFQTGQMSACNTFGNSE